MVFASYVARNPEGFTLFTGPGALKLYVEEMPEKMQIVVAKMDRSQNATNIAKRDDGILFYGKYPN